MTDDPNMEKFERAVELLANNAAIQQIETDGPHEADADGNIVSMSCRVHLQGVFTKDDVRNWLTMHDPHLGVETRPSDEFEEWGDDGAVTYVSIEPLDA